MSDKLTKQVANYLTAQFIGVPSDFPDDECIGEAQFVITLIRPAIERELREKGWMDAKEIAELLNKVVGDDMAFGKREVQQARVDAYKEAYDWLYAPCNNPTHTHFNAVAVLRCDCPEIDYEDLVASLKAGERRDKKILT